MVPVILEMSKFKTGGYKKSHRRAHSNEEQLNSVRQGNTGSGSLNSSYASNDINDSYMTVDRSIIQISNDKLHELAHKQEESLTTPRDQEYLSLLTDNEKGSEDFQEFILDVFTTLEFLDSAGISLNDLCVLLSSHPKKAKEILLVPLNLKEVFHFWSFCMGIIRPSENDNKKQNVPSPSQGANNRSI